MRAQSLAFRIVVLFVGLLAAVLFLIFAVVSAANLQISHNTTAAELLTGERVLHRLLEQRGAQLAQGAKVLAQDFGFRQAVATRDADTIVSVLQNSGVRIQAQLLMLSSLDNQILADTADPAHKGQSYPFPQLLNQSSETGGKTDIEWIGGKLYWLVAAPVRAPLPIAWVTMGFVIDDATARDLQALSGLQVTLLGRGPKGYEIFASTLPAEQVRALPAALPGSGATESALTLAGESYETRLTLLGGSEREPIYGLLARARNETLAPFYKLEETLVILAGIGVLLCLAAGLKIAGRITEPLRALAIAAERIEQGDYGQTIAVKDRSEIGQLAGSVAHMQAAIAEREAEITKLAYQDGLTGLPNRVRYAQLLSAAIDKARQQGGHLTILLIGLDRFQQINDTLGHPTGDRVLAEVGARLKEAVRGDDVVARQAGDEFSLLLPGADAGDALHTISRIHRVFDRQFVLDGRALDLRASVGAAGYPEHGEDAIELMRCVDLAMYRAKRGGERQALYDPSYRTFREEHLSLLGDLQRAVERNELTVHYQPKVNLGDGRADEAEALVRWIHPERGFVPPGDFIPFAEQTGYIKEVTRWMLAHVIAQAGAWAERGTPIKVSINLSTRDLLDQNLPQEVGEYLEQARLAPQYLCLEITESGFMEEPARALDILRKLRALGVGLAIDDYGTGFSSLAYLRKLPITELKIDRAFVLEIDRNASDALIVQSTIELGKRLGLRLVAEGVETQAIVDVLATMGCDLIQGFFYSKPLPAEAFMQWREQRMQAVTAGNG